MNIKSMKETLLFLLFLTYTLGKSIPSYTISSNKE